LESDHQLFLGGSLHWWENHPPEWRPFTEAVMRIAATLEARKGRFPRAASFLGSSECGVLFPDVSGGMKVVESWRFEIPCVVREAGDRIVARRPHWHRTGGDLCFSGPTACTGSVSLRRRGPFSMLPFTIR